MRACVILFLLLTQTAPARDYYVSCSGSDQNPGTLKKPFATLERARDAIRKYKQEKGHPPDGFTVYLGAGDYHRQKSFELDERDSGKKNAPVTYTAQPGAKARLIGGVRIDPKRFIPVMTQDVRKRFDAGDVRAVQSLNSLA